MTKRLRVVAIKSHNPLLKVWTFTDCQTQKRKARSPGGRAKCTMTSTQGDDHPGAFPQWSKAVDSGNWGKGSTQIVSRLLQRCHHGLLAWSTVGLGSQWSPGQCQLTAGPLGSWAYLFHSRFFGLVFPWISAGKESVCNVGDLGLIPGWEYPLEKERATHSSILA